MPAVIDAAHVPPYATDTTVRFLSYTPASSARQKVINVLMMNRAKRSTHRIQWVSSCDSKVQQF
jgi:hypothetical protein